MSSLEKDISNNEAWKNQTCDATLQIAPLIFWNSKQIGSDNEDGAGSHLTLDV